MNETANSSLHALERSIMARAEELAQEFHDKANRQRDNILRDAAERLHMAEEREVLVAKADAERHFHRVTQASELKMQARLDQLRWELVQSIQTRLQGQMLKLRSDRGTYRKWLVSMIRDAAELLPEGPLTAEVNSDDLQWLPAEWSKLIDEAAPGREISLAESATWGSGGVRLRTVDNRAQVDNRFEGRLSRMEASVQRVILQTLFPTDIHATARSGGLQ